MHGRAAPSGNDVPKKLCCARPRRRARPGEIVLHSGAYRVVNAFRVPGRQHDRIEGLGDTRTVGMALEQRPIVRHRPTRCDRLPGFTGTSRSNNKFFSLETGRRVAWNPFRNTNGASSTGSSEATTHTVCVLTRPCVANQEQRVTILSGMGNCEVHRRFLCPVYRFLGRMGRTTTLISGHCGYAPPVQARYQ